MRIDAEVLAAALGSTNSAVAVLDSSGRCRASFGGFRELDEPITTAGVHACGDRDVLVVPIGDALLAVELPKTGSLVAELERLAVAVRQQASAIRRRSAELERADHELSLLRTLVAIDDDLLAEDSLGAATLERLAARVRPLCGGRQLRLEVEIPGQEVIAAGPQFECPEAVELRPGSGVAARAVVQPPADEREKALLRELAAKLLAAGTRTLALRHEAEQAAARERAALTELLAHEANSPLAALVANLEFLLAEATGMDDECVSALSEAREAALRVAGIVRRLETVARQGTVYQRISVAELARAFDAHRGAQSIEAEAPGSVLGERGLVLEGIEEIGAQVGGCRTRVGVDGRGVVFVLDTEHVPAIPKALAERGVEARLEGGRCSLSIPFRLVPGGSSTG